MHVQRHSLLGTIPLRENYGMTFDLWNNYYRVCSVASASVVDREVTCIYVHGICTYACVALFSLRSPFVCVLCARRIVCACREVTVCSVL